MPTIGKSIKKDNIKEIIRSIGLEPTINDLENHSFIDKLTKRLL